MSTTSDPSDIQRLVDLHALGGLGTGRAVLVMSAAPDAMTAQHALRGYRYALLEAGHLAQNVLLRATSAALPACPPGGFADDALARVVADGAAEMFLYAIAM